MRCVGRGGRTQVDADLLGATLARAAEGHGAAAGDEVHGPQRLELDIAAVLVEPLEEQFGHLDLDAGLLDRQPSHLVERPAGGRRLIVLGHLVDEALKARTPPCE